MNFLYQIFQMNVLAFTIPTYIDAAGYLLCHTITGLSYIYSDFTRSCPYTWDETEV